MEHKHAVIFFVLIISLGLFIAINPHMTGYSTANSYVCGDGKCTIPYEDEVLCPSDCSKTLDKIPWVVSAIALLIIGIIYINYYRGRFNLRKLTRGKIPFSSEQELAQVVNFIEASLKKHTKNEIIKMLLNQRWQSYQIKFAFEEVSWKKERKILNIKRNIPTKSKNLNQLDGYIQHCLKVRMSIERIRSNLLLKGWKQARVDEAIRRNTKNR